MIISGVVHHVHIVEFVDLKCKMKVVTPLVCP